MKRRTAFLAIALCLLLVGALAAFAGGKTEGGATTYKGAGGDLVIWGSWSGTDADQINEVAGKFMEKNPTIKAVYTYQENFYQKLLTSIAAGTPPDALLWDRFLTPLYAPKGALLPLDDLLARDKIDKKTWYPEAVKELTVDGKFYGMPLDVDNRGIFYNKAIFREVGLDPNKPPTTWDELEKAAIKCTKWDGNTLVRSGFALNDIGLFSCWIQQAGGWMVDDKGMSAVNTPAGKAVLDFWSKLLFTDKVYVPGFASDLSGAQDPFITGQIAMKLDGPWIIPNIKKYGPNLDFGTVQMPAGPNGKKGTMMGGWSFAIANKTKKVEEAWQFVKWFSVDPANNSYFAARNFTLPSNLAAAHSETWQKDPYLKAFVDGMEYARTRPSVPGYSQYQDDAVTANLQLFVSGKLTAEEALKKAEAMGNQILAQNAQ
jgi:multiple sugar transport system substrate-binding protein